MKSDLLTKSLLAVIAICMCAIVVRVWLPSPRQSDKPKFDHVQLTTGPLGVSLMFFDERTGDIWIHGISQGTKDDNIQHVRIESIGKPIEKAP